MRNFPVDDHMNVYPIDFGPPSIYPVECVPSRSEFVSIYVTPSDFICLFSLVRMRGFQRDLISYGAHNKEENIERNQRQAEGFPTVAREFNLTV